MKKIILLFFAFHFVVLSCNILSKHLKFEILNSLTSIYTFPFFQQEWEMFAPPPTQNTRLYFRYLVKNGSKVDTSEFKEILRPLYKAQTSNEHRISRVSYYLFNSSMNILSNYAYWTNKTELCDFNNEKDYQLFINEKLSKSFSHNSLIKYGYEVCKRKIQFSSQDSVFMSYHVLQEDIPQFEERKFENIDKNEANDDLIVWNSSFYKIYEP